MAAPKQTSSNYGQCKCCLQTTYLKNLWEPQENCGQWEVYGQMLVDCFGIDWTILTVEDDNICQVCISKLRVSSAFKRQIQESQATALQQVDDVAAVEEVESTNRVQVETIPTLDGKEVEVNFVPTTRRNDSQSTEDMSTPSLKQTSDNMVPIDNIIITSPLKQENTVTMDTVITSLKQDNSNNTVPVNNIIITSLKTEKATPEKEITEPKQSAFKNTTKLKTERTIAVPRIKEIIEPVNTESNVKIEDDPNHTLKYESEEKNHQIMISFEGSSENEMVEFVNGADDENEAFEDTQSMMDSESEDDEDSEPEHKKAKANDSRAIKRRSKRKVYSIDSLRQAVEAVATRRMSRREAARVYNVPRNNITEKHLADMKENMFMAQVIKATKALLTYTNATPFKVSGQSSYRCFFCGIDGPMFRNPDELRHHTHSEHPDKVTQTDLALRPKYKNQMVRFDIYKLKCQCGQHVTWENLFEHLQENHGLDDIDGMLENLVPYILKTQTDVNACAFPSCNFSGCFNKLDNHMNVHYPNYLCGECGKPFITEWRLRSHRQYHQNEEYRCYHCPKLFNSKSERDVHRDTVHGSKLKIKCKFCPEKFQNNKTKLDHLNSVHADKLDTNGRYCNLCGNYFWHEDFARHVKFEHRANMKPDTSVKKFKCAVCSKMFFRKDAVLAHISHEH